MKKVAILGPESSGKSTLASKLAIAMEGYWVPEYAREYLFQIKKTYLYSDLLKIAKGQTSLMNKSVLMGHSHVFFDTDLISIKIWSDAKFGTTDEWILKQIPNFKFDLIFLLKPVIEWEKDDLRESETERDKLFEIFVYELESRDMKFEIIDQPLLEKRVDYCIKLINELS